MHAEVNEGVTACEYLGKLDCKSNPALRQVGLSPDRYLIRQNVVRTMRAINAHRILVGL
jgi:hypothetical protein